MIFVNSKKVDKTWQLVKTATEEGELGILSKFSTAKLNPDANNLDTRVICVYIYDWSDKSDVFRVERQLRKIGVKQALYYKTDVDMANNKYKVNNNQNISLYISKAVKSANRKSLSSLYNVGEKKARVLKSIGINNIDDLLKFDTSQKLAGKGVTTEAISKLKLYALSQVDKTIFKVGEPDLPNDNILYFDIETDLNMCRVWFISTYYNGVYKKFYAKTWNAEKRILIQFQEYIWKLKGVNLFSYSGTNFDRNVIAAALKRHVLDYEFFNRQAHYDVCTEIKRSFILPLQSYGLKEVGKYLKYRLKNKGLDGLFVAEEYIRNQETNRELPKEIFDYVEDDVKSIHYILQELNSGRHKINDLTLKT